MTGYMLFCRRSCFKTEESVIIIRRATKLTVLLYLGLPGAILSLLSEVSVALTTCGAIKQCVDKQTSVLFVFCVQYVYAQKHGSDVKYTFLPTTVKPFVL